MKTLLVIAKQSGLAAAIKAVLDSVEYRILSHEGVHQAESILTQGLIDICVMDAELTDVQPIRLIKHVRRLAPDCPIIIYTANKQWEWEEEAYVLGVEHILAKPVRGGLLNSLLQRLRMPRGPSPAPAHIASTPATSRDYYPPEPASRPDGALKVLRDFSAVLTHSLCSDSLLKQFLLLLREVLGVNRAAIFLRRPISPKAGITSDRADLLLRPVCALGLAPALLDHLVLSPDQGIGHYVYRSGRILKNGSDEARADLVAQKEFALLGAQVAIPILDRESLVGVALFDGRLTGEFFANEELALIFHLLEGVGLAIKNSWLYDQLAGSHEMLTDVLNELEGGCIVVNQHLEILHANPAAQVFFLPEAERARALEFRDLPQIIASKVFQTIQSGGVHPPFTYRPNQDQPPSYQVRIRAFEARHSDGANSALLLVDDITPRERLFQLELEASSLRLMKSMASQLAHEMGNAIVPVATCLNLKSGETPESAVQSTLAQAADDGCRRISRLIKQVQILASDGPGPARDLPVREMIETAAKEAQLHSKSKNVSIRAADSTDGSFGIRGDGAQLTHALAEIILNALQAAPPDSPVKVGWLRQEDAEMGSWLCVDIEDAGQGFTAEVAEHATDPFFSTRTVGLGLGLTVARRIIEAHRGRIELSSSPSGTPNLVRVFLPIKNTSA